MCVAGSDAARFGLWFLVTAAVICMSKIPKEIKKGHLRHVIKQENLLRKSSVRRRTRRTSQANLFDYTKTIKTPFYTSRRKMEFRVALMHESVRELAMFRSNVTSYNYVKKRTVTYNVVFKLSI